jgi:hypothetical protein
MDNIRCTALFLIPFFVAGCATSSDEHLTVYESSRTSSGELDRSLTQGEAQVVVDNLAPYARMAEVVYREDLKNLDDPENPWSRLPTACKYVTSADESIGTKNLPEHWHRLDKDLMVKLGMEPQNPPGPPLKPCRADVGLEYETYIRLGPDSKPLEAVISFRGTENKKHQWLSDWAANFSNVDFGVFGNSQFTEAREEGTRLIKALARVLPKTQSSSVCKAKSEHAEGEQAPIDLVGHSLGGGLAQHVAYANTACNVRSTVAFDPSPATGWFYLHWRHMVENKDPIIYRVYLDGEALSYVRYISTKFNFPRDNRKDIRMVFSNVAEGAVGRHAMRLLSDGIDVRRTKPLVKETEPRADHISGELHPEVTSETEHK